jgi:phosphohistidine swiveling domain-containing protein
VDWRVPDDDDTRTWAKGWGGPYPRLEQDWWLASARHSIICFEEIGAFTCILDGRTFVNGYPYDRVPTATFEEAQARRDEHGRRGHEAIDEGTDLWERDIRPEVERLLAGLRRRRPRRDDNLPGLVEHVERCMDTAGHIMGDLHWRMAFGIPGDWSTDYPALTGGTDAEAAVFLQGLDHATSRLLKQLRHLARLQRDGDPAFEDEFADLIKRFGMRTGRGYGSAAGFRDVTWSIDPSAVRELIDMYAKADLDRLDEREAASKRARQQAMRRMRRRHAGDPGVWPKLERAHRAAIARCKAMENHNHLMEQETEGILRHAFHRLGTALVAAGAIEHHDDVFHLHRHELRDLARRPRDVRALVAEREAELAAQTALDPPAHLGAPPSAAPLAASAPPPVAERPDGHLPGTAASPGVATGRARVVADIAGFPDVEPGDILVARDAGPAWTPVFALLGGLVLDDGWTIQHAAIVCRELGIPCVLATRTATSAIEDGATVIVDGDLGLVRVAG